MKKQTQNHKWKMEKNGGSDKRRKTPYLPHHSQISDALSEKEGKKYKQEYDRNYGKEYYLNNKQNILKKRRLNYTKTRIDRIKKHKIRYENNKKQILNKIKKYKLDNKEKIKAQNLLNYKTKSKKIIRIDNCQICNSEENLDKHHFNYSEPFNFLVVCRSCHLRIHSGAIKWEK